MSSSPKRHRIASVLSTSVPNTPPPSIAAVLSNDYLLNEILLRLPTRPLLRFKSVSKRWLSLITHPSFYLLSLRRCNAHPSGLFLRLRSHITNPEYHFLPFSDHHHKPPFRTLAFIPDPSGTKILQSCNGLLCCSTARVGQTSPKYYVCNPTTKHFSKLPSPGTGSPSPVSVHGVCLAFDPARSPHYRAVCVRSSDPCRDLRQIEIYSSTTGPWRVSGEPFTAPISLEFNSGVYWNGAIHWISKSGESLCFDIEQERFKNLPVPPAPECWQHRRFCYFGQSGDHLHLIERKDPPTAANLNVYELERDYSRWVLKFRLDLNLVAAEIPEMIMNNRYTRNLDYYGFNVLALVRGEKDDEESYLVVHTKRKIIRYDLVSKRLTKLGDLSSKSEVCFRFGGWLSAFPFVESLAFV